VDVHDVSGYLLGLLMGAEIFSVIGLLAAKIVDSKSLGLNIILTLAILDTAFLENPVFSRRYDEWWIDLMPSHRAISMILKSSFELSSEWLSDLRYTFLYLIILIIVYVVALRKNIGLGSH